MYEMMKINDVISGLKVFFWVGKSKSETEAPIGIQGAINVQSIFGRVQIICCLSELWSCGHNNFCSN